MNRLIHVGMLTFLSSLHLLKIIDPNNLLFELLTINTLATIMHGLIVLAVLYAAYKNVFTNKVIRKTGGTMALLFILGGLAVLYNPNYDAYVKLLDSVLAIEFGIILGIASWSRPVESAATPSICIFSRYLLHTPKNPEPVKSEPAFN